MEYMDIETVLQEIGFNKKEVKVYLALLQLGQDTAFQIAKKSGVKRATCYLILETLKKRGLASTTKTKRAMLFSPLEPQKLYGLFKEKEGGLKATLPELEAMYNMRPQKPRVQMFEGAEGMRSVYRDAIAQVKSGHEILFFSTLETTKTLTKDLLPFWKRALRENKNARARELFRDTPLERAYAIEMKDISERYPIRFIPQGYGRIANDFIIFENKIALVSFEKDIFATIIEDKELTSSFRVFYEMAWRAGAE